METLMKLRILDKSNKSIARGTEPTVRCSPISSAGQGLCKNKDFNKPRSSRRSKFLRKFSLFLRVLRALRGKKNAFTQSP